MSQRIVLPDAVFPPGCALAKRESPVFANPDAALVACLVLVGAAIGACIFLELKDRK